MRTQRYRVVAAALTIFLVGLTGLVGTVSTASAVTRPTIAPISLTIDCGTLQNSYYASMHLSASVANLQPAASYQLVIWTASENQGLENDVTVVTDNQGSAVVDTALTGQFVASGDYTATLESGGTSVVGTRMRASACASNVSASGAPTLGFTCASRYLTPSGVNGSIFHLTGTLSGFVPGESYQLAVPGAGAATATADANGSLTFDATANNNSLTNPSLFPWSVSTPSQYAALATGTVALTSSCPPITKAAKRPGLTHDADLTGDGYADLLAIDWSGNLWQYTNGVTTSPGHLPFSTGRVIGSGWTFEQVAEGDLTGDGYADLVGVGYDGSLVAYYNNISSNPGRLPFTSGTVIGSGWQPFVRVALGDVNGDGYADIIAGKADGTNYLYLNHFASDPLHRPFSTGVKLDGEAFPLWGEVAAGDFNGDGYADLTTMGSSLNPNRIPAGSPTPFPQSISLPPEPIPSAGWSLGDYEGRGSDGLVLASPANNGQLIYVKDPLAGAAPAVIGSGWQMFWQLIH